MAQGVAKVKQILQAGAMTARELHTYGVRKEAISRAVRSGEVQDDAAVHERDRFITLYYLDPDQLETRRDVEIYVSRSGLEESEKEAITSYVNAHADQDFVWVGNAERELGFSLTGDSPICTKRRDFLLRLAKDGGIEVRDGYDEGSPLVGSRRWWAQHVQDMVTQVETFFKFSSSDFRPPREDDLLSFSQKNPDLALQFGCRAGGILYPKYHRRLMDDELRSLLEKPLAQHAGSEKRVEWENILSHAVEHCRRALDATEEIWKAIEGIATSLFKEGMPEEVHSPYGMRFVHAVYFLYQLAYRNTMGIEAKQLEVDSNRKMIVYPYFEKGEQGYVVLLDSGGVMEIDALRQWTERLNAFVELDSLHRRLQDSLREVELSERQLDEVTNQIMQLVQTWKIEKLTGECQICRGVTPRPSR